MRLQREYIKEAKRLASAELSGYWKALPRIMNQPPDMGSPLNPEGDAAWIRAYDRQLNKLLKPKWTTPKGARALEGTLTKEIEALLIPGRGSRELKTLDWFLQQTQLAAEAATNEFGVSE